MSKRQGRRGQWAGNYIYELDIKLVAKKFSGELS